MMRIGLFLMTNLAVLVVFGIVASIFGIGSVIVQADSISQAL